MEDAVNAPVEVTTVDTTAGVPSAPAPAGDLEPNIAELDRFFGVAPSEAVDLGARDQMRAIWNFYAQDAKTEGEVIRKISEAERGVEPPKPGETRLGKLYFYVMLLREESSLKDEIAAYKR